MMMMLALTQTVVELVMVTAAHPHSGGPHLDNHRLILTYCDHLLLLV